MVNFRVGLKDFFVFAGGEFGYLTLIPGIVLGTLDV